jgi:uncharacterized membrane protein (UPF0127 family)
MAHRKWLMTGAMVVALVAAAFVYFQTQQTFADSRAMVLPVDSTPLVVVTDSGERSFSIEVADEPAERAAGLMYRETMADDHGMLFVFGQTQEITFWMKNTPMPLDLIFIGQDGRIKAIKQGEPQSVATISPGEPVRFVLELKAGTAARGGIADGDLLKHPVINTASGSSELPADNGDAPNAGTGQ